MPCLLPADCLNEIFENLEYDKPTLYSCLLVNRLWCKVSVRILWRDIWGQRYQPKVLSTLISCLPNESKELLHRNEIFISTPTLKPSLFNYASFFKVLKLQGIARIINPSLRSILNNSDYLVAKEILKMFMNQISSLKRLTIFTTFNITFTSFPGARDCLTDLSELHCASHAHSEFFYGLSQICHNLQSLTISIESKVSNGLKELVSSQNNLKFLDLSVNHIDDSWTDIIPALMKHLNTLTKLHLCYGYFINLSAPLSFVSSFLNLQEIKFSFSHSQFDFKKLQYATFPKLQILKITNGYSEDLTKFLEINEINGKYLQELYINNNSSNLSIAKFCPNLKKLYIPFDNDELDTLKTIFNSCQRLEGLVIWYGKNLSNEKELLETVAKHSPKNFHELKLRELELFPENLESFFVSWQNRGSKKSISLIVVEDCNILKESMKIIEKYKNLGVIKKLETIKEYGNYYL